MIQLSHYRSAFTTIPEWRNHQSFCTYCTWYTERKSCAKHIHTCTRKKYWQWCL